MAVKRSTSTAKPVADPVAPVTPVTSPRHLKSCGGLWAVTADKAIAAEGCKRLPRHHGDHVTSKPRGLMTTAERLAASKRRIAAKVAPNARGKVVSRAGTKYRQTIGENGVITLTPVVAVTPVAAKVTVLAPSKKGNRRRVAAPIRVTRRPKTAHPSGRPSAHLA
jgi:hypothetical protein